MAQEVEKVSPELVRPGPDGYKQVDYIGLIGPMIEAIKELDAGVQELERKLGEDSP